MSTVSLAGLAVLAVFAALAVCGGSIQAWLHKRSGHAAPAPDFSDLTEAALPPDEQPDEEEREEAELLPEQPDEEPEQPPADALPDHERKEATVHTAPHPLTGQQVTLRPGTRLPHHTGQAPITFRVEDWADRVLGKPWASIEGHSAVTAYGKRAANAGLPQDNEVLYGRDAFGMRHLVHTTEIDEGSVR